MDPITISSPVENSENTFTCKGKLNVYYHFYYPDDVVSAEHFKDLCEGLSDRHWQVSVFTSNRYCRKKGAISPTAETINGVNIKRCWRPAFNQSKNFGRLANSFLINSSWLIKTIFSPKPDFFIIGTDPQFSQFLFPFLKLISPKSKIVHWCFDLYPEAVAANTNNLLLHKLCNFSKPIFRFLYGFVDIMVDIGECMKNRLNQYQHKAIQSTLVPWALVESEKLVEADISKRKELFGNASLVLLYSGNLGQAHQYSLFLNLARKVRRKNPDIVFAFSSSGNRFMEFKANVSKDDSNILFLPFAKIEELRDRLISADIHLISLKDEWSGIVVPSKFFGSLAVGRPLLFYGPSNSAINHWIEKYNMGFNLSNENLDEIASNLIEYAQSPPLLDKLKENSFSTYYQHFSKNSVINKWDEILLEHKLNNG